MPETLDFGSLDLRAALDLAILIEEEARERYEEFADQMESHHTAEAAGFFRFMASNEDKHGKELLARFRELFPNVPRTMKASSVLEVEAPEYEKARAFMTPRQALTVALDSERKAHAFFVHAIGQVADPGVKQLFAELRDEEIVHQELVSRELEKLPPEAEVGTEDFEDEPVAL